jgi:hypothetical protein
MLILAVPEYPAFDRGKLAPVCNFGRQALVRKQFPMRGEGLLPIACQLHGAQELPKQLIFACLPGLQAF